MKFPVDKCWDCDLDLTTAEPAEVTYPGNEQALGTCPQCGKSYFMSEVVPPPAPEPEVPETEPVAEAEPTPEPEAPAVEAPTEEAPAEAPEPEPETPGEEKRGG